MLFIFLLVCILKNTRVNPVPTDIQDLAARGQNWRFYDENFRFLRQTQASIVPWSSIHWQLWLRSQYSQNKKLAAARNYGPPTHARQGTPFQVPKGYCFKFHKGIPCLGCDFKHSCFKCQGAHIVPNIVIFVHLQKNHSPVLDALPSPHLPTPVKKTKTSYIASSRISAIHYEHFNFWFFLGFPLALSRKPSGIWG